MRYSVHVRCRCTGPDGKLLGQACPRLWRGDGNWNGKHGSAFWTARIPASGGTRQVKRSGFGSKQAAREDAAHAGKLLDLAGPKEATRAKIGDLIASAGRGQPLPAAEDVRRRLALGQDPSRQRCVVRGGMGGLAGR